LIAEIFKNVQNETTKRFLVGNTKVNSLVLTAVSKSRICLTFYNFKKLCLRSLDWLNVHFRVANW